MPTFRFTCEGGNTVERIVFNRTSGFAVVTEIIQHHFQAHGRKKRVADIRQIGRGTLHIAQRYRSTRRKLKASETDRLVEDILFELFLSLESARLTSPFWTRAERTPDMSSAPS